MQGNMLMPEQPLLGNGHVHCVQDISFEEIATLPDSRSALSMIFELATPDTSTRMHIRGTDSNKWSGPSIVACEESFG